MTGVRVAGVGLTRFGVQPQRTGRDLFAEAAAAEAHADVGVDATDVEFAEVHELLHHRLGVRP